eukprot:9358372-Alexandrium_andersonii.AAC.1
MINKRQDTREEGEEGFGSGLLNHDSTIAHVGLMPSIHLEKTVVIGDRGTRDTVETTMGGNKLGTGLMASLNTPWPVSGKVPELCGGSNLFKVTLKVSVGSGMGG